MPRTSQPKRPRALTAEARERFVADLANGFSVTHAATSAGVAYTKTLYRHRDKDEEFAKAWDDALEAGADVLEDEAKRRAVEGISEPIYDREGNHVGDRWKYSDTLLIFLLKGRRPQKFRDHQTVEMTGKDGGPLEVEHRDAARDELMGRLAPVIELRRAAGTTGAATNGSG